MTILFSLDSKIKNSVQYPSADPYQYIWFQINPVYVQFRQINFDKKYVHVQFTHINFEQKSVNNDFIHISF